MSPVSTPPTQGPSLCGINVTNTAMHGAMLLLLLCGLVGNMALLLLFRFRRMRRNPITIYIFHQASTDFFFLTLVPPTLVYKMEEMSVFHVLKQTYLMVIMPQALLLYNMGLCLLTAISIERCRSILCPLWCRCHCPLQLSKVVDALLTAIYISFILAVNPLCLLHEHRHIQVAVISMYTLNLFLFAPAMVISSTILFVKLKRGSQQQLKKLDIIIFLMVLFALPLSLWNFLQQLGYACESSHFLLLLACIHSSVKPYICFLVGSCGRHYSMWSLQLSLRRVFEEPEENTAYSNDAATDTTV